MQKNYELVQKGFRILHPLMANYIGSELVRVFKEDWWNKVLAVLNDQHDLPLSGTPQDLINSLDILNCLRLIDRCWAEVFKLKLSIDYRTWAKELIGVRNKTAHIGPNMDFPQSYAERALDTMALLCGAFNDDGVEKIRAIYRSLRYGSEEGSISADTSVVTHKKTKNNEGVLSSSYSQLPSWRNVIQPHPDVAEV